MIVTMEQIRKERSISMESINIDQNYYQLLLQLQEYQFALVELNLYLDTHPDDQSALLQFNQLVEQREQVANQIEENYGPLFNFGLSNSEFPWQWKKAPWPWQV
ncbi:spore coat protein CotJB [Cytobacillus sp. FJAT-54145]|uniref:Spore coat protein CotJB n=1 Tax=Cytobacillus spartinae TaxID=3299023 RepID=A0ABW6KH01_9BACI